MRITITIKKWNNHKRHYLEAKTRLRNELFKYTTYHNIYYFVLFYFTCRFHRIIFRVCSKLAIDILQLIDVLKSNLGPITCTYSKPLWYPHIKFVVSELCLSIQLTICHKSWSLRYLLYLKTKTSYKICILSIKISKLKSIKLKRYWCRRPLSEGIIVPKMLAPLYRDTNSLGKWSGVASTGRK